MATTAPPTREHARDALGFGGLVPSGAVGYGGETLVAVLGIEHHAEGMVVPLLVLSESPGLVEWEPALGLTIHDDRGARYDAQTLNATSSLGQLAITLWVEPPPPPEARQLTVTVQGLERLNPTRGGGRGVARPLAGGPWTAVVALVPERTMAEVPAEPSSGRLPARVDTVPIRARGVFVDVVPVGQARLGDGIAVCVLALERYWDRAVATLVALGRPGDDATTPAIGRASLDAWDDRGRRYRVTPVHGAARGAWSEVAAEIVPAIPPDASILAIRVAAVPRGTDSARRDDVPGPFLFAFRLPAE